jgi:hypothetical protein
MSSSGNGKSSIVSLPEAEVLRLFHHRSELAKCRVRTACTRQVIRVVEHRSLRRSPQDLKVAMACSTRARIFAWDRFTAC